MSLSDAARRLGAALSLDFAEKVELHRLRLCKLQVPATFESEREELIALRAELQRELAEVRELSEKDWPLAYAVEAVAELYWRRPLAEAKRKADEAKRKADEAALEEKARLKREADEERRTYARQKHKADEEQAQEEARLKREADEERRTYARQKRDHDLATLHTTLTPAERAEQDALRKNWAEHGALSDEYETETDPIHSCPDDCGRLHLSPSAACACANVRNNRSAREVAAPTRPTTSSTSAPTRSTPTRPTTSSTATGVHQPLPAPSQPAPRSAMTPSSSSPRPTTERSVVSTKAPSSARPTNSPPTTRRAPTPANSPPTRPNMSARAPTPATTQARQPAPAPSSAAPTLPPPTTLATARQARPQEPPATSKLPPGSAIPPPLRGRILDACATQELRSYRDILAVVRGSARAVIQDAIREMDGSDIALVNGVYRPLRGRVSHD